MNYLLTFLLLITLCSNTVSQRLETVVQRGHYAAIKSVAFTNDGNYLLSGSRDKTIKLWELATGREIRSYLGHESTINDLVVTPDGKYFVSSSADKTAKLWEIATGKLIRTYAAHKDYMTSVALSPDGKLLVTAGYDQEAILWELKTGEELKRFKVNPDRGVGYGISADFSPNGKQIAFGGDNRSVVIYDIASAEEIAELKPEMGRCGGCGTFVKYFGNDILSAGNGGDLKLWDMNEKSTKKLLYTNPDEFTALDHDGTSKVFISTEDSIKLFNLTSGKILWQKQVLAEEGNTDATLSPDGKKIALSNDDKVVRIYDLENGNLLQRIEGFLNQTDKGGLNYKGSSYWDRYIKKYTDLKNDIKVSPNGKYFAKGKLGNVIRLWDFKNGSIFRELSGHEKAVLCMEFSRDGKQLLTGSADETARLWDVASGQELMRFEGHREMIFTVAFSEDQSKVATGSWDGSAKVWDIQSGEMLSHLPFEQASPYQLEFVNNDIYLMVAGLDKTLKLWEIDSKREVRDFVGHTNIIHSFDIHPDNRTIVSTGWDGKVKVWDITTGLQTARFSEHRGEVYCATYSHQGELLTTAGADRVIHVRDRKGIIKNTLKGHTSPVTNLQFTPDDKHLISVAENGEIKIWNISAGTELVSYMVIDQSNWMAVNSFGHFNATDGAFSNIVFVKGIKSFSVDQFFEEFFQPDLIKNAFSDRGGSKLNMLEKIEKSPPPSIDILSPQNNDSFDNRKAQLLFRVFDEGGGASLAKVFHNGKNVLSLPLQVKSGKSQTVEHSLDLVEGINTIEVSAISKGNIESPRKRIVARFGGSLKSTLYLFSIGIDKYVNEALNLNYAASDAEGFVALIKAHTVGLFDKVEVRSLYDHEATKDNILWKLDELATEIKPQDVLYFFYAGHGSMVDNNFYFVPTDNTKLYNPEKLAKTGIYAGELQEKLKSISALKQVVIIDACQSGGGVETLAQRGATEEKALAQLSRSTGIHVLAAAGSEQFATEFKELGHGLFTYVLLEALSGKADGAPKDGKVTIYELKSYLDDQVPEFSQKYKGKMQFPHTFSRGQDFPVVVE
ncbi:caspase family protein [Fulvivirga sp. M361]|uniref:caspase family protein n=1 Tax=Fulvivirga sp. M361 TaxID=2594266 RepID=UPI0016245C96|nr:caspase family protein [Fulvivirga sp. M361]